MAPNIEGENFGSPEPTASLASEHRLDAKTIVISRRARKLRKALNGPYLPTTASEPGSTNGSEIGAPEQRKTAELHGGVQSKYPSTLSGLSAERPITEIDFAELEDGTLIELVENPERVGRKCFAVWKDGEIRFEDKLEQDGQVFVPLTRNTGSLGGLRLPTGAEPYQSVHELLSRLECMISQCIAIDDRYVPVLADFVLSTWFIDRFSVAPYLSVVGLPQSGKTTLLKVLSLVCRRPLLIADITSAFFYRACSRFMPTILIDETATASNNRTLRHILRSGTTRDVLAVRNDCSLHSYGAKVVTWLEPPDDPALNSRCIVIPMSENKGRSLVRTDDAKVQQLAVHLQAQLLRFRLDNFKTVQPAAVPGDEVLRPRVRDLLHALTAAHADVQRSQRLLKFLESSQGLAAEPLSPEQNAILRVLFLTIHLRESFHSIQISRLTEVVNSFLEEARENLRLQPRKVGAVLTSLGFCNRSRTNSGWSISVTRQDVERLHQLAACYGLDGHRDRWLSVSPDDCSLCQAAGLASNGRDSEIPEGTTEKVDFRKILRNQEGIP